MKKLIGLLTIAVVLSGASFLTFHVNSHAVDESGSVTDNAVHLTYDDGPGPDYNAKTSPTA